MICSKHLQSREVKPGAAIASPHVGRSCFALIAGALALSASTASFGNSDMIVEGVGSATAEQQLAPKNNNPTATTDYVDFSQAGRAFNVLANDSDVDDNPLTIVEATAKFGAVAFTSDGLVAYAANPGQRRADEIIYVASDGQGGFVQGRVVISIQ